MDATRRIWRWQEGEPQAVDDQLAVESPLEICVQGEPINITMRTPGADDFLALGFLWTEGVITAINQIEHLVPGGENQVLVSLTANTPLDTDRLSRHVVSTSSCGICGKTSMDGVFQNHPPLPQQDAPVWTAETLQHVPDRLREVQSTFHSTGGLHAAALFDAAGEIVHVAEDVGRHNAVDKVLGAALHAGSDTARLGLMVSGRSSFEITQKALIARIPLLAAVSAPSSLAVDFAEAAGQTMIGFLRPGRMNLYCHPNRVAPSPT